MCELVATGADHVEDHGGSAGAEVEQSCVLEHHRRRGPRPPSGVSPLDRRAVTNAGHLGGGGLAAEDLVHRPAGRGTVEVLVRQQAAEDRRPGGRRRDRRRIGGGHRTRRGDGDPATQQAGGRIGERRPRRAGGRPRRRPVTTWPARRPAGRPTSSEDGRAAVDLVLELPADAHAARGGGLTVEDEEVESSRDRPRRGRPARSRTRDTSSAGRSGAGRRPRAWRTCCRTGRSSL